MGNIKELQEELKRLQKQREEDIQIKKLKKQIKAEKFAQTKGGKIFNKVADVGDAGFKWLVHGPKNQPKGKKRKVPTVNEVMKQFENL